MGVYTIEPYYYPRYTGVLARRRLRHRQVDSHKGKGLRLALLHGVVIVLCRVDIPNCDFEVAQ